ncbi:MAG: ArsR/SmtB family transcription factor [Bacteroidota bacterium]
MGITKTEVYDAQHVSLALQLKALGHPARLAIVQYLVKKKECICNDIVNELSLAQPTISQHLKELKNAEIIQGTIEGKSICYCLNPKTFKYLAHFFEKIEGDLTETKTCC